MIMLGYIIIDYMVFSVLDIANIQNILWGRLFTFPMDICYSVLISSGACVNIHILKLASLQCIVYIFCQFSVFCLVHTEQRLYCLVVFIYESSFVNVVNHTAFDLTTG